MTDIPLDSIPPLTVTAPDLHDQTLEQVLISPAMVPKDDRKTVRVYDILDGKLPRCIHAISLLSSKQKNKLSYTSIFATAIIHGYAIIEHKHSDLFSEIEIIDMDSIVNKYDVYDMVRGGISASIFTNGHCTYTHIDTATYDAIASRAHILNMSSGQLITACVLSSLDNYPRFTADIKDKIHANVESFDVMCNIVLRTLREYKY
jgi:hypothetical protein